MNTLFSIVSSPFNLFSNSTSSSTNSNQPQLTVNSDKLEESFVDFTTKGSTKPRKVVFSIDGGGVRGVIPLTIINEISKRAGLHPSEFVHLSGATSTGALLSTLYFAQADHHPLFKTSELPDFWMKGAQEIFTERSWIDGVDGLFKAKYTASGLENVISRVAKQGMSLLNKQDFACDLMFPTYDATARKTIYLSNFSSIPGMKPEGYLIESALRSTTAAPYYLPANQVFFENNESHAFLDGGLFANDPALQTYLYANQRLGSDLTLFSFGTGKQLSKKMYYQDLADQGIIEMGTTGLLDHIFDSMESSPNQILTDMLGSHYYRFQVDNLDPARSALDSVASLTYLEEKAKEYIEMNQEYLESVCSKIQPKENLR